MKFNVRNLKGKSAGQRRFTLPTGQHSLGYRFLLLMLAGVACFFAASAWAVTGGSAPFTISARLLASTTITNTQPLTFPAHLVVASGAGNETETVAADAGTAAIFTAVGEPDQAITADVTASTVTLNCTSPTCTGDTLSVGTFTFGGTLSPAGQATFDSSGNLTNLRVGATLTITDAAKAGSYSGTGTFRITYNV